MIEEKKYTQKDMENGCIFFCDVLLNSPSMLKEDKDLRQIWREGMGVSVEVEILRKARKRLEEELKK